MEALQGQASRSEDSRTTNTPCALPLYAMLPLVSCAFRSVKAIKPLGCLAMIDDGELDWKVCILFFAVDSVSRYGGFNAPSLHDRG